MQCSQIFLYLILFCSFNVGTDSLIEFGSTRNLPKGSHTSKINDNNDANISYLHFKSALQGSNLRFQIGSLTPKPLGQTRTRIIPS